MSWQFIRIIIILIGWSSARVVCGGRSMNAKRMCRTRITRRNFKINVFIFEGNLYWPVYQLVSTSQVHSIQADSREAHVQFLEQLQQNSKTYVGHVWPAFCHRQYMTVWGAQTTAQYSNIDLRKTRLLL